MAIIDNSFISVTINGTSGGSHSQVIPLELLFDFMVAIGYKPQTSEKEIVITDLDNNLIRKIL